jgi:hypothetical protein
VTHYQTNKRKIVKRIVLIVSLLAVIAIVIELMQSYIMCRFDAHQRRIEGFYLEKKNSLDLVIVGSSEVYNDYVPPLAYEKCGITSYIYGFQADPASLWSYQLREIERTQNPEIVLIECNGASYDKDKLDNPAEVRFMTDDMPLSLNKIELIHDKATEGKPSYFFPFLKYHTHLIPSKDILNKRLLEKRGFHILGGAQARITGETNLSTEFIDVTGDKSIAELDPDAEMYLRDFLEQCKKSDIEHIVFVRFPHRPTTANYLSFQRHHRMEQIIEEYGFDYIDFDAQKEEMGINEETDFLDCEHMNSYGARKLTEYMVPYLMERYQLEPEKQSAEVTRRWERSADYYNHLYEYWCHVLSSGQTAREAEDDLNDNYGSNERLKAYYEAQGETVSWDDK